MKGPAVRVGSFGRWRGRACDQEREGKKSWTGGKDGGHANRLNWEKYFWVDGRRRRMRGILTCHYSVHIHGWLAVYSKSQQVLAHLTVAPLTPVTYCGGTVQVLGVQSIL